LFDLEIQTKIGKKEFNLAVAICIAAKKLAGF